MTTLAQAFQSLRPTKAALYPQPIVLSASIVSYTGVEPGGTTRGASRGIWNSSSSGILISDFVLRDRLTGSTGDGTAMSVRLRYKNEPLTNGFVPFVSVSTPLNRIYEYNLGGSNQPPAGIGVIRMAKPLYLEPGDLINVEFQNPLVPQTQLSPCLYAVGIQTATPPVERWLPYFTSYIGPAYAGTSNAVIAEQSNPTDLGNPFDQALFIDRLVGRVLITRNLGSSRFGDLGVADAWYQFNVRLTDHKNLGWIPQATPVPAAFDAVTRSWPVKATLDTKGFLILDVSGTATWGSEQVPNARISVGMQSYRRIG